jgi:hypothetical protein
MPTLKPSSTAAQPKATSLVLDGGSRYEQETQR